MKCYIANTSPQVQELYFWMAEVTRPVVQRINMGEQVLLGNKELNAEEVDRILEQLAPYGVADIRHISQEIKFSGVCYQFNKPIDIDALRSGVARSQEVAEERSLEARKTATAAINEDLQKQTKGSVKALEVETSEQPPQNDPDADTKKETLTIGAKTVQPGKRR
jgi:hypothetical protein